ncbi:MAG: type I-E CRISPR-associated protein Cas6/Cse3/CasE [Tissierellia bacterium]|jgi:CRISPR system Cascade subunit CasE|nr:type I-E CRISPR-associated protein Cas6/Cse3/CasE [Tissierellia bacterium]
MFLSRVKIDRDNRRKIRDLSHLGAYHNWVEGAFPEEFDEEIRSRKLWRVDFLKEIPYLLLVSETKPDIEKLERYGIKESVEIKSYDSFLEKLKKGMRARFRVKLNPVVSKSDGTLGRGKIIPLVSDEDQIKFLMELSEKNGFKLLPNDFNIVSKGYEVLKQPKKRPINIVMAEYEGILTITDLEKFLKVLKKGIGKKKAYGFGMMTVIPYEE